MGRDAVLYIVGNPGYAAGELEQVNQILTAQFSDKITAVNEKCLWLDGKRTERMGEQILCCYPGERYYDEDYPRGNLLEIASIADWLEKTVGEVYYCANDDKVWLRWTEVRQSLLNYYLNNGSMGGICGGVVTTSARNSKKVIDLQAKEDLDFKSRIEEGKKLQEAWCEEPTHTMVYFDSEGRQIRTEKV